MTPRQIWYTFTRWWFWNQTMAKNVRLVRYKSNGWFEVQRRHVLAEFPGWEDVHESFDPLLEKSWAAFFKQYKPAKPPEPPYEVIQ